MTPDNSSDYLYRRNTVLEALRGQRRELRQLWLQDGARQAEKFSAAARARGIPLEVVDKARLSSMVGDGSHQGVVLETGPYPYSSLDEILALAVQRGERPFLLLLDLLHGPHNIGALLRTAEACGVHGVVLQDRRAPDITAQVVIHSAGAAEHLLIAQVTNLVKAMQRLRQADVWLAGLDLSERAQPLGQIDLDMALAIIVGHEGDGLRRLVRQKCDFLLKLPMRGQVASLNAATAGAIVLYAAWQARGYEGA
ncbi:MAG TPA: 23S rRNA (guanosine(2251)-2'-O)-methyltransferase RlmB [Anaerolineae bacterium]|jgi:23S rRNA (guanosine2251-2'-O)-methyltransferase|nr:23S rRNA (guanosine(2251)-2'-O)-methyltransferase RlmB [Anaerolineae bacterium]